MRIDERTRIALEEVKEFYGFGTDADAIRGMIALTRSREKMIAEMEGRLVAVLRPYIDERIREYGHSDEYKDLIRALMDEVIKDEVNGKVE